MTGLAPTLAPSRRSALAAAAGTVAVTGGDDGIRTHDPLLANQSDVCGGVHRRALKPNRQGVEHVLVCTAVQGGAGEFGSHFGSQQAAFFGFAPPTTPPPTVHVSGAGFTSTDSGRFGPITTGQRDGC